MRVMAIGAHPDDLEILCAGTLARYVAEGHSVIMCHVARGDLVAGVLIRAAIAAIRPRAAG